MSKKRIKKKYKNFSAILLIILISIILLKVLDIILISNKKIIPENKETKEYYSSSDFGFITIKSQTDYNKDNLDDYTQFVIGAKTIIEEKPEYISKYYQGGYPPETEAVNADVIWKAFQEAGYNIKEMITFDMKNNNENNLYNYEILDPNIDFRRVENLRKFFSRYAEKLTTNVENIKEFNPGDIIIFDNTKHIGIISDKRNESGIPYLINHRASEDQISKEEDILLETDMEITQHYRFTYNEDIEKLLKEMSEQNE